MGEIFVVTIIIFLLCFLIEFVIAFFSRKAQKKKTKALVGLHESEVSFLKRSITELERIAVLRVGVISDSKNLVETLKKLNIAIGKENDDLKETVQKRLVSINELCKESETAFRLNMHNKKIDLEKIEKLEQDLVNANVAKTVLAEELKVYKDRTKEVEDAVQNDVGLKMRNVINHVNCDFTKTELVFMTAGLSKLITSSKNHEDMKYYIELIDKVHKILPDMKEEEDAAVSNG